VHFLKNDFYYAIVRFYESAAALQSCEATDDFFDDYPQ